MPAEVKYHLERKGASGDGQRVSTINARHRAALNDLMRLAKNAAARQEMIELDAVADLVRDIRNFRLNVHSYNNHGDSENQVPLIKSMLKDTRKLLGNLLLNDENANFLQLLFAAAQHNAEYNQILILQKTDAAPTHINRKTLIIQFGDDDTVKVYWAIGHMLSRVHSQTLRNSQNRLNNLLALRSLQRSEDQAIIREIRELCGCCFNQSFSDSLHYSLQSFDEEFNRIIRSSNDIKKIVAFISEFSGSVDNKSLDVLIGYLGICKDNAAYLAAFLEARGIEILSAFLTVERSACKSTLTLLDILSGYSEYDCLKHLSVLRPIVVLGLMPKIEMLKNQYFLESRSIDYIKKEDLAEKILKKCNALVREAKESAEKKRARGKGKERTRKEGS